MKLALSILSGLILIGSMSSCTTYVEDRRHHSGGYRSTTTHHGYRSSSYRDRDSSTRVRTNVQAPLGISSGVGVDLR